MHAPVDDKGKRNGMQGLVDSRSLKTLSSGLVKVDEQCDGIPANCQ